MPRMEHDDPRDYYFVNYPNASFAVKSYTPDGARHKVELYEEESNWLKLPRVLPFAIQVETIPEADAKSWFVSDNYAASTPVRLMAYKESRPPKEGDIQAEPETIDQIPGQTQLELADVAVRASGAIVLQIPSQRAA